ncbi:hypothetical protein ES708_22491 [subsurface metagenome]
MGIRFLTISGGEPFHYRDKETGKDLWDLAKKHNDMYFQIYTNGTLLDEKTIERLAKMGNVAPAISMEGFKKERGSLCGDASLVQEVFSQGVER